MAVIENKTYGVIYMIKCHITKKCYIGQTTRDLSSRINEHLCFKKVPKCLHLENAIKKYGRNNFYYGVIKECYKEQEQLNEMENYFINYYNSIENGYNIRNGGSNGKLSKKTRNKISIANTGKKRTDEFKINASIRMKGKNNHRYGIKPSKNTRKKISESNKGKIQTEKSNLMRSLKLKNRIFSDETIKKISNSQKGDKNHRWKKIDEDLILKMFNEGNTYTKIASVFDVSIDTIKRRILKLEGIV